MRRRGPCLVSYLLRLLARQLLPQEDEGMSDYTWFTGDGPTEPPDQGCTCHRCEAVYKVDLLVCDDDWKRVRGGCNLLCPACIMQSLEDLDGFGAYRLHKVDELAAKDAEIAELRKQLAESQESLVATLQAVRRERDAAEAAGLTALAERDEALECVRRLWPLVNEHVDCLRAEADAAVLDRKRRGYLAEVAAVEAALAATPERLR